MASSAVAGFFPGAARSSAEMPWKSSCIIGGATHLTAHAQHARFGSAAITAGFCPSAAYSSAAQKLWISDDSCSGGVDTHYLHALEIGMKAHFSARLCPGVTCSSTAEKLLAYDYPCSRARGIHYVHALHLGVKARFTARFCPRATCSSAAEKLWTSDDSISGGCGIHLHALDLASKARLSPSAKGPWNRTMKPRKSPYFSSSRRRIQIIRAYIDWPIIAVIFLMGVARRSLRANSAKPQVSQEFAKIVRIAQMYLLIKKGGSVSIQPQLSEAELKQREIELKRLKELVGLGLIFVGIVIGSLVAKGDKKMTTLVSVFDVTMKSYKVLSEITTLIISLISAS